jgi:transposase
MFIRSRRRGPYTYLQLVENSRDGKRVIQRVIANLGRLDLAQESGALDSLLRSGARFSERIHLLDAHSKGQTATTRTVKIGPVLLMEKLWRESGIKGIVDMFAGTRRFGFSIERVIFTAVLQRLFRPGSDRAGERWMRGYDIPGGEELDLQHFYRTMGWLGEPLGPEHQADATPFIHRSVKDLIEEHLFAARRDLFSAINLVFFDTTALYFEGNGGETIGQYGHSKDHRPDLRQMVVGVVLDDNGNPVCSELWPGNIADVKSLVPVATRLRDRFGIQNICIVADRGMISAKTIEELERMKWSYILGVRMRVVKGIRQNVLTDWQYFRQVYPERTNSTDPAPLKVKQVWHEGKRYIVCHNEEEARKDRHAREAIVAALRDQLRQGDKSLVGNKGYRRFLKISGSHFEVDEDRIGDDALFDGRYVLQTNMELEPAQVAMQYKQLWIVEDIFRTMKSLMDTRPVYHKCDDTIRGHVFCSFLALVIRKRLQDMIGRKGWKLEWDHVVRDVDAISRVTVNHEGKRFVIRTEAAGTAGKVFQAAGVALPPVLQNA